MAKAKRVADGHGEIADAQFIGVRHFYSGQVFHVVELQQGDIGLFVTAYQLGVHFTAIVQLYADFIGVVDHVVVGQHIALGGGDDDAGTQAFKRA
ncbi:hypothetical protein D3C78_1203820 [compost metagenome]